MLEHRSFYYLRHGQTEWNLSGRAQSQQDVELNATGRAQAASAIPKLLQTGITAICVSPLKRALETASIISAALQIPTLVVDDLKEACWGECEGARKGAWFEQWKAGVTPVGAEPFDEFIGRGLRGLNTALESGERVLIVAHGGTYWAVESATGVRLEEDAPNCTPIYHSAPSQKGSRWILNAL